MLTSVLKRFAICNNFGEKQETETLISSEYDLFPHSKEFRISDERVEQLIEEVYQDNSDVFFGFFSTSTQRKKAAPRDSNFTMGFASVEDTGGSNFDERYMS